MPSCISPERNKLHRENPACKLILKLSLRAGSLSEREPARIPMMFGCRLSIRMSQVN